MKLIIIMKLFKYFKGGVFSKIWNIFIFLIKTYEKILLENIEISILLYNNLNIYTIIYLNKF